MDATDREIILKELDHIQVIMGRYDTFFFLMKQVCLGGMATVFVGAASNKLKIVPFMILGIPLLFFMMESTFRFFYWTRYVSRIETIREFLQGKRSSISLYEIAEPQGSLSDKARWCRAIKRFDIIFYATWAISAIFAGLILVLDQSR